jgi:Zn-dependent peptidase ImmA (M78 family)
MVRSILDDEDEAVRLPFVGSRRMHDGVGAVLADIRQALDLDLTEFRSQASPEGAFALLRSKVEDVGVFVLLIGNLGSHHTAIDVEAFRGFALADEIAPFVVINDQDAKTAWSFTLLHELAHIWLGATGVSGASPEVQIERFCNDVASSFLLPDGELGLLDLRSAADNEQLARLVSDFAVERHLSRSMVAYRMLRSGALPEPAWRALTNLFRAQWRVGREAQRERNRAREGGPNYYVIRRHRLGTALLRFVARNMADGALTPTKAAKVLGVKARSVAPLLSGAALPVGQAA